MKAGTNEQRAPRPLGGLKALALHPEILRHKGTELNATMLICGSRNNHAEID